MRAFLLPCLAIALAACATNVARAYDGVVDQCASCATDAAFRQTAKQYYGIGSVTLYNLKMGAIHSYVFGLKRGYADQVEPPPEAIEVMEAATDPIIYSAFANVSGFYQAAGYRLQAAISIPYTDLGPNVPGLNQGTSAYDVTEDYNLRNRIGIEIVNNKDKWNQVRAFVNKVDQMMLMLLGLKDEGVLEVRVIFSDGSTVLYRLSTKSMNSTKLEYVPGSATTPRNQGIPDSNQPQYQGRWYGPQAGGDDMGRFGKHMNSIGVPTNWNYNGGSNPREVQCTWKTAQSGNTLICVDSMH